MLALQGITMDATSHAIAYLAEKDMTRNLSQTGKTGDSKRRIELSKEILAGTIATDSIILLDAFSGAGFRNQSESSNKLFVIFFL
jgi:ATP-dependent Clp protease ATP-binding subunit ClpB